LPELPEVEVVRRGLARHVVGRAVVSVHVGHPRAVRRHRAGPADFVERLTGSRLQAACRRGKYLWLPLQSGDALVAHLGMSGQLLVRPAETPAELHLRVRVTLGDPAPAAQLDPAHDAGADPGAAPGSELRFVDQRTFGGLSVDPLGPDGAPALLAHIARDPFDPLFDDDAFVAGLRRRRTGVKRALLDQTLASGIGNIYADEALWRARLHYARPTETLRRSEAVGLLAAVREVMAAALAVGGTSFDALYVDVDGASGYFDRSLAVYGQRNRPCPRCGTPVRRDAFMGRSSYTCPRCQPRPRRARW